MNKSFVSTNLETVVSVSKCSLCNSYEPIDNMKCRKQSICNDVIRLSSFVIRYSPCYIPCSVSGREIIKGTDYFTDRKGQITDISLPPAYSRSRSDTDWVRLRAELPYLPTYLPTCHACLPPCLLQHPLIGQWLVDWDLTLTDGRVWFTSRH